MNHKCWKCTQVHFDGKQDQILCGISGKIIDDNTWNPPGNNCPKEKVNHV